MMEFESMREAQEERETYLHDAMAECVKAGVSMETLLTLAFETGFKRVYLDALIKEFPNTVHSAVVK